MTKPFLRLGLVTLALLGGVAPGCGGPAPGATEVSNVGLAFNISVPGYDPDYGEYFWVCIDNVSLRAQ